ncbi:MAG: radical SAM protein [Candidatus Omnitrophica bacterium]|nr:radical SAM protein [Candidatus Omnitrophota bacterium]
MKKWTRRDFIKSGFLALLGTGAAVSLRRLGFGRESNEDLASSPGPDFVPSYLKLHKRGELKKRGEALWAMMSQCRLCPRECGTNRFENKGFCHSTDQLQIASYHPHFGEERPLVGRGGSGTIFLSNCSLRCVFCINWEISQGGEGGIVSLDDMAGMMLALQSRGCHNINIVTPTHYSPHILLALDKAAAKGLRIPLVWNTCGWEKVEVLRKLDGIVDIYLPDFKYADSRMAAKYSSDASFYPEVTKQALLEMHRQVGVAKPAKNGLMRRGLMLRHLVMPNNVSGTKEVLQWVAANLPKDTYINLMSQYTPIYKAHQYPDISRTITEREYSDAVRWAKEAGLTNVDYQWRSFAG